MILRFWVVTMAFGHFAVEEDFFFFFYTFKIFCKKKFDFYPFQKRVCFLDLDS